MPVNGYTVIDSDGHLIEDQQAIIDHMPEVYRKGYKTQVPLFNPFPQLDHMHSTTLVELLPGAFDFRVGPTEWLAFLDELGCEASVLYPTMGLSVGKIHSADFAIDTCRAYNDWQYENYVKRSSKLKGIALLPLQDPEAAADELKRAVVDLKMVGGMLPGSGANGVQRVLGHKSYWPIYEVANKLGCALGVHGGSHENMGMDDLYPFAATHALGHPFAQMISFASLVFAGIPDRFPNAKFAFLEGGVAWLLLALERFDGSYGGFTPVDRGKRLFELQPGEKPSGYIARHIEAGRLFVGVEGDEPCLPDAVREVGNKAFVFSSDFPHEVNAASCKHEIEELLENDRLSDADKRAILADNARALYSIKTLVAS
jgi:predicted TIM-barrel fold metal-dependent hydrolase